MELSNILTLLEGLAFFLFGMKFMGDGLQQAAGQKMRDILEKLTRNRFMGFILGMVVTCCIQSSAATTVMVMGFINASIMDLAQATGVIFGANLGTTITSILIALDVSGIAPVCIFCGALVFMYAKKNKMKRWGQVFLGFGILFLGLHTMSSAMSFLKTFVPFQNFIVTASNPLLGFIIGIIMATILQSSSAAVGILQALAMQGLMPLNFALYLVCGINVGSSMPPILSSIGAKNNAKRAAAIYTIFNLAGAAILIPIGMFTPLTSIIANAISSPAFQVSFVHIIFKVLPSIILLPLTDKVVQMAFMIVPKQEHESEYRFNYIDTKLQVRPEISRLQVNKELERMADIVRVNYTNSIETILTNCQVDYCQKVREEDELISWLDHNITDYMVELNKKAIHTETTNYLNKAMHVISELERIGDYAVYLVDRAESMKEKELLYSEEARGEISEIVHESMALYEKSVAAFFSKSFITNEEFKDLQARHNRISHLCEVAEANHVARLQENKCTTEAGVVYVKVLSDFDHIGEHSFQIAKSAQIEYK